VNSWAIRLNVRKWGEFLGYTVEWSMQKQVTLFNGQEVHAEVILIREGEKSVGYAPVRELVAAAGLKLEVDEANRTIMVTRPVPL
jgi:hypothetical protein